MTLDGARWIDATPATISSLASTLYTIFGVSKSDIWVGGYEYALHFNGGQWRPVKVADSMIVGSITEIADQVYLQVYSPWGKDTIFIYTMIGDQFKLVDYTTLHRHKFGGGIFSIGSKLYTITDGIISTILRSDNSIDTANWQREFTTSTYLTERAVQSAKNVFAVGQWNLVYHWNGSNWSQVFITMTNHMVDQYALFWGVWTDSSDLFICDWQNGIIYHGR